MPGIRKQAHPERVAPSAPGTSFGSWSFATPPAWRAKDEIRAPATLVEATFHATADAGSIPAVSIGTWGAAQLSAFFCSARVSPRLTKRRFAISVFTAAAGAVAAGNLDYPEVIDWPTREG